MISDYINKESEEFTPHVTKEIFANELKMCRKLYHDNHGNCNWGTCSSCGVIPLLIKLHEGRLIEDTAELLKEKEKVLGNFEEGNNV